MDGYLDPGTESGQMFVNRVVQDLKDTVMQAALVGIPDVHPGPFPDGIQTFKFINLRSAVNRNVRHIRETGLDYKDET
jgi:hypothetical protein